MNRAKAYMDHHWMPWCDHTSDVDALWWAHLPVDDYDDTPSDPSASAPLAPPPVPPPPPPSSSPWTTAPAWKTSSLTSKQNTSDQAVPPGAATSPPEWRSSSILDSLQQVKRGGRSHKGKKVAKVGPDQESCNRKRSHRSAEKHATARGNRHQHGRQQKSHPNQKHLVKERGGGKQHCRAKKGSGRGQQKQEGSAPQKGRAQEASKPAGQMGKSGKTKKKPQKPPLPNSRARQGSTQTMRQGILPR